MPNKITFGANLNPVNIPMEVSIDSGSSFVPLSFSTVGTNQQGILTSVLPGVYVIGQLVQRAIGYASSTTCSNQTEIIVIGAATPPPPTYSYTTTFTDFTKKCGQGIDPGPQTRTSTVSLADAQAQAIAAITCPVAPTTFSATYQSIAADYQTKCSAPAMAGYQYPSGAGTDSTQDAANAAAKADALSKITCAVVQVSYANTLSINNQIGTDGVSFVPQGAETFEYDALTTSTSGPIISVIVSSGGNSCYLDYNSEDAGRPFRFTNRAGAKFAGNLPASDTTLTY